MAFLQRRRLPSVNFIVLNLRPLLLPKSVADSVALSVCFFLPLLSASAAVVDLQAIIIFYFNFDLTSRPSAFEVNPFWRRRG